MEDRRQVERRRIERRQRQLEAFEGWDGVERRSKRDRRKGERRRAGRHSEVPPAVLEKKSMRHKRREVERSRDEQLKKERLDKELRIRVDRRRDKIE